MYDNNGKVYESNSSGTTIPSSGGKDDYIERFVYINSLSTPPDILNVEVAACVKGQLICFLKNLNKFVMWQL
jgi:predicted secreted protein